MSYRIFPDGVVETASLDEAAELSERIRGTRAAARMLPLLEEMRTIEARIAEHRMRLTAAFAVMSSTDRTKVIATAAERDPEMLRVVMDIAAIVATAENAAAQTHALNLSAEERQCVEAAANAAGMSPSEWARRVLLEMAPCPVTMEAT